MTTEPIAAAYSMGLRPIDPLSITLAKERMKRDPTILLSLIVFVIVLVLGIILKMPNTITEDDSILFHILFWAGFVSLARLTGILWLQTLLHAVINIRLKWVIGHFLFAPIVSYFYYYNYASANQKKASIQLNEPHTNTRKFVFRMWKIKKMIDHTFPNFSSMEDAERYRVLKSSVLQLLLICIVAPVFFTFEQQGNLCVNLGVLIFLLFLACLTGITTYRGISFIEDNSTTKSDQ